MRETTITELHKQTKRLLNLVEGGETVRVLRNGIPIADIRPIRPGMPSWKQRKARPVTIRGDLVSRLVLQQRR